MAVIVRTLNGHCMCVCVSLIDERAVPSGHGCLGRGRGQLRIELHNSMDPFLQRVVSLKISADDVIAAGLIGVVSHRPSVRAVETSNQVLCAPNAVQ